MTNLRTYRLTGLRVRRLPFYFTFLKRYANIYSNLQSDRHTANAVVDLNKCYQKP